jgi:hypothetical protein
MFETYQYAHQIHQPASALKTIPLTQPFALWGLDMVGAFKPARGKMTHILVMVAKFIKWIEEKPISKCDGHTVVKFLKDIIVRYDCPHSIITNNGSNFAQGPFARYCKEVGIWLDIPSVAPLYQWPGRKIKWASVIRHKTQVDRAIGENSRLLAT